jgi:tight adherence protein B
VNPLTVTFFAVLAFSFSILMISMRPAKPSKITWQRLVSIHESIPIHPGVSGAELEKATPWGYSIPFDLFLQRYQFGKKLKVLLLHANSKMSLGAVVSTSAGMGLGFGMIGYLILQKPLIVSAAALAGAVMPYAFLRMKRNRRLKAFDTALPDAIDLMARSLVAGHSIGSSIEIIAERSPEPLAFEFVQVYQQQRLGVHFRDALLQMGSRIPSRDLQFLITAILVQKETGGDLTEILDRAAHVIRDRVRIGGEVRSRTAQGRMTGWILGLLPVIMLILINIVSPGYSNILFQDPFGQQLLYAGAILILIGALFIRKIVNVQV